MSSRLRRIVARVDETGRSEDTQEGRGIGNNSSLFRIYALLKNGKGTGEKENKVELNFVKYFPEIGVEKQSLDNFNDGGTGAGCAEQIDEVYYVRKFSHPNLLELKAY
ncbi:peptidoglycan binding domain protein [Colletotrichum limetticola]|uniref:Peptidoglycan binding domain protein n=1 Tax=Colletotrichum limetticola TaxID=1209924 RepID=A0ABQ9Q5T8_9PEZI|nr:peptidoglycan binding domain protein [Colletotrichum limetticola]